MDAGNIEDSLHLTLKPGLSRVSKERQEGISVGFGIEVNAVKSRAGSGSDHEADDPVNRGRETYGIVTGGVFMTRLS